MPRYRKRPVVVEAIQWKVMDDEGAFEVMSLLQEWSTWGLPSLHRGVVGYRGGNVEILTLEGTMTASPGDWIIRGIKGELYPCKPDIFEATYEAVDDDEVA